jgi:ferritin-like metal-binding protein YciE
VAEIPAGTNQLVAWLDDAYAMESGRVPILQNHATHFGSEMPATARRLQQHIVEAQQHASRLEQCLRMLNASPSAVKSTLSSMMGSVEGATTAVFRDQLMKDALTDFAAEQFEVGCYTALVNAATELGYLEVAQLCKRNLAEDRAMADWLLQQIPAVASHDAVGAPAQRRA